MPIILILGLGFKIVMISMKCNPEQQVNGLAVGNKTTKPPTLCRNNPVDQQPRHENENNLTSLEENQSVLSMKSKLSTANHAI